MKGITFEREMKGYSAAQVEAYIDMLQENYEKTSLTARQAEETVVKLTQQIKEQQIEGHNLHQRLHEKEQEINRLKELADTAEKEKKDILDQVNMPKYMTELYVQAQAQAKAYVEKVKQEIEVERSEIAAQGQVIIAQAKADAQDIKAEARQEKCNEFEAEKERLLKEQADRMAEIAYLRQEAEAELTSAREESESIIRQARLKIELAEDKNRLLMEKTICKSRQVDKRMHEQYQQIHSALTESTRRLSELFEYIANIDEAKSIEEIRKYSEGMETKGAKGD